MARILFLDLDGVANGHEQHAGLLYTKIMPGPVAQLNRILHATDCKMVLSSAWRYILLREEMTLRGFQYLLLTHGVTALAHSDSWWMPAENRLVGYTTSDEQIPTRGRQIQHWLDLHPEVVNYVVLDDAPNGMCFEPVAHRLVKTDGTVGLTAADADRVIAMLLEDEKGGNK